MPIAEYSMALRKRSSLSVMCLRSARKAYITMVMMFAGSSIIRNGSQGAFSMTPVFWVVMGVGLVAIISDTIITVIKKTRKASSRGRRTALHISNTMTQVNGQGRNVIAVQHRHRKRVE